LRAECFFQLIFGVALSAAAEKKQSEECSRGALLTVKKLLRRERAIQSEKSKGTF
jgi:hypothetical protein